MMKRAQPQAQLPYGAHVRARPDQNGALLPRFLSPQPASGALLASRTAGAGFWALLKLFSELLITRHSCSRPWTSVQARASAYWHWLLASSGLILALYPCLLSRQPWSCSPNKSAPTSQQLFVILKN